ncbi:MAG: helix-turn-helix transcriptional regulator [Alteromonadaceae bacterium]|nr:helix-turn-helix transcriptional regulator [Alteromonadaceae bacterium]
MIPAFLSQTLNLQTQSLLILLTIAFSIGMSASFWQRHPRIQSGQRFLLLTKLCVLILALAYVIQQEFIAWQLLSFTLVSLQMLIGPLIYFYTRIQTVEHFTWQPHYWLHCLPTLLFGGLWLWQLPLTDNDPFLVVSEVHQNGIHAHRFWHKLAAWVSVISYSIAALRFLRPHEGNMKERFSELSDVNLTWLKGAVWSILGLTIVSLSADISRFMGAGHSLNGGDFQAFGPFIMGLLIVRYGFRQQEIFPHCATDAAQTRQSSETAPSSASCVDNELVEWETKYATSSLTKDEAARLWQRLQTQMQAQQPYLEPGLKISQLADALHVSVNHLSETINGYAKLSFYDYINSLRIEEAKSLLHAPDMSHLSVTDIGYQSGFNSNSTFYTHFKKFTGMTPRQYRAQ